MALAFVKKNPNSLTPKSAYGTSCALASWNVTEGNLLIVVAATYTTSYLPSIADDKSNTWTQTFQLIGATNYLSVWYCVVGSGKGGDMIITLSTSSNVNWNAAALEVSGNALTSVQDVYNSYAASMVTLITSNASGTPSTTCLFFGAGTGTRSDMTSTWADSTALWNVTGNGEVGLIASYKISAADETFTATYPTARGNCGVIVGYKELSGTPSVPDMDKWFVETSRVKLGKAEVVSY